MVDLSGDLWSEIQGAKKISNDLGVWALAEIVSVSLKEDQQQETANLPDHNRLYGGLMLYRLVSALYWEKLHTFSDIGESMSA